VDVRSLAAQIEAIVAARRGQLADGPVFWGRSMAMRRLRHRLDVLASGRLPVVLMGPTGTGKSLIARHYVHARSGRSGRFVAVDLSTLPTELMAAHLFGSVKGAYTSSVADRVGAFESAHGGTLFLDEVGNLAGEAQKMLLTVLQEGVVTRLGDLKERAVDVKLVVATHEDLAERVRQGTFRSDLYMRLNPAAAVHLPGLDERQVDLDELLAFCVKQALERPYLRGLVTDYRARFDLEGDEVQVLCAGQVEPPLPGTLVLQFPERTMRLLRAHAWPGNLREFAMTVENALLFALSELSMVSSHERADVVQVRAKLVRDLLDHAPNSPTTAEEGLGMRIALRPHDTLNKVSVDCERQYFSQLFLAEGGDFGAMARVLLGSDEHARKVQLRFNQLGLKVRDLKERLKDS
jgi:two-component system nitrogen regulation response regulator GlnG